MHICGVSFSFFRGLSPGLPCNTQSGRFVSSIKRRIPTAVAHAGKLGGEFAGQFVVLHADGCRSQRVWTRNNDRHEAHDI